MGRILSVWSPNWPITTWRRRHPGVGREDEPFALVETDRNARRLRAVNAPAAAMGFTAGMKLTDALAVHAGLAIAPAEPETEAQALRALCDWCVRYSPAVALDPPDGLFLEVSGMQALWEEEELLADLRARLQARGIPAHGAVAVTPGAAWALARFESSAAVADEKDRLRSLPVAALRLDPDANAALHRLGLRTIGQVAALPRSQLSRRFGQALLLRLDQAFGEVEEALAWRRAPAPWFERLAFAEPISAPEDLVRAAGEVLRTLCARLEAAGRGARRFTLTYHRLDGRLFPLTRGMALADRDAARLGRLFAPKLETVDPGFGVEVITVEAARVELMVPCQARLAATDLAPDQRRESEASLAELVDKLRARLGEGHVWRAEVRQSWNPERAVARADPFAARSCPPGRWDPTRPRPVRLFARPEPIEAMAPVPDDPPVQFRWRGRLHRVRAAEGPERLAEEWWRRPIAEVAVDRVRDYYRVEDAEGARFWIFRAGLYRAGEPSRWFVHGLFG